MSKSVLYARYRAKSDFETLSVLFEVSRAVDILRREKKELVEELASVNSILSREKEVAESSRARSSCPNQQVL